MTIENDYEFTQEERDALEAYDKERSASFRKAVVVTLTGFILLIALLGVLT